jgi:photosystem II stability/assembly factor-like uncharacterized protein
MLQRSLAAFLFLASSVFGFAQADWVPHPTLTPQNSGTTQLLIAVSAVNSQVVWAAGTGGTFVVTTDGGNTWKAGVVSGAKDLQFRDVQGVTDQIAYLLSIGNHPDDFRIFYTDDGGAHWQRQFTNERPLAFYDCFAFWSADRGLAHSDSGRGIFPERRTTNGEDWLLIAKNMPPALPGEASFAASGTCITTEGEDNAWIATGGSTIARILATTDGGDSWNAYDTPLVSNPSAGGISVAFRDALHGVVGGGDLTNNASAQMARSKDGGQTWKLTEKPPVDGAIFCLAYASGMTLTGTPSSDHRFDRVVVVTADAQPDYNTGSAAWTPDEGHTWYKLKGVSGYWGLTFADPQDGWFVGNNGQILKISF